MVMTEAVPGTHVVLAGRYRLVRPIARGGMAEVWEGHDSILDRPVAVKMLHGHLAADETFLERFRREAISAARLSHPNIIATYDTGSDRGMAYIVMELVRGNTLARLLADEGPLGFRRAVAIGSQVADALDYAHRSGIVHRDVKPANILLCDDGQVKVSDFGIAKAAMGADLTQTGAVLGTMKYLSPEQVDGRPQDGRSDVYALGVVLYEMLCGRPPFAADTELATAIQHLQVEPARPRRVRAGIPRPLEAVVVKAMAKAPGQRFGTAAALRDALLKVDVADDDATVMIWRDRTPPGGVTITPAPPRRSWPVPVILCVAVAIVAGLLVFVLSSPDREPLPAKRSAPANGPVRIVGAAAFDPPPGSEHEHDEELPYLFDGDPNTAWSTETYAGPISSLKSGVGVVLSLDGDHRLSRLQLTTPSAGWSASVYVSDGPRSTLVEWGRPVATASDIRQNATFDLGRVSARAVLIWITDLGAANSRVAIGEVGLSA